jgi:hypothetical protein
LVEEQKAETELEMKREIKYLLEQWIIAKNNYLVQKSQTESSRYNTTHSNNGGMQEETGNQSDDFNSR